MAQFDMRGQKVNNQYVAGHDLNFGTVQNSRDLIAELEHLRQQLSQAKENYNISEEIATDAEYQVTKAIQQVKKPEPDKKTILDYLHTAKSVVEGVASASGLVTTLVGAIEAVQKLFS